MLKKVILLLLLFAVSAPAFAARQEPNIYPVPRPAPDINLFNRVEHPVKLKDFAGDFVVAVFWSRHCLPCIRELDNLADFANQTSSNGVKTLIISREDEWRDADEQFKFLKRRDAESLDFYVDREGKLAKAFGIFSSPHTVLLNREGEEIGRLRGQVDWDDREVIEYIYKIKAQNN